MPSLADLQAGLAVRLTGDPAAEMDPRLSRAARALRHKRLRAVAQLLPRSRLAASSEWVALFAEHARNYTPCGLLYHVDDAWEFANAHSRSSNRRLRQAARIDLAWLKLRFTRGAPRTAHRVRERTGFYVNVSLDPLVLSVRVVGRRPLLLTPARLS